MWSFLFVVHFWVAGVLQPHTVSFPTNNCALEQLVVAGVNQANQQLGIPTVLVGTCEPYSE